MSPGASAAPTRHPVLVCSLFWGECSHDPRFPVWSPADPGPGPGDQGPAIAHCPPQVSPGIIANPFAAGVGRRNSLESVSSIDRELSPEGPGKVRTAAAGSPGPGSPRPWGDRCLLCSQDKEPPAQTPQWGPEAKVSVELPLPCALAPARGTVGVDRAQGVVSGHIPRPHCTLVSAGSQVQPRWFPGLGPPRPARAACRGAVPPRHTGGPACPCLQPRPPGQSCWVEHRGPGPGHPCWNSTSLPGLGLVPPNL